MTTTKPIMTLDLNMGTECLENWQNEHAIRELIANALDEHVCSKVKQSIDINYHQKQKTIEIIDYGKGITEDNFIHQTNQIKKNNSKYIGYFGIGLKDSLGVLCKNNVDITIYTKKYIYKPEYKNILNRKDNTLHIDIFENNNTNIKYGTKIVLSNINKKDLEKGKQYFLIYTVNKYIELYKNETDIILEHDDSQIIYINGFIVCQCKKDDTYFSYNLSRDDKFMEHMNRDRDEKNFSIFKKYIQKNILEKIFNEDSQIDTIIPKIINILSQDKLKEFNQIDIIKNILEYLNNTNKYIFIDKEDAKKTQKEKYKNKLNDSKREVIYINKSVIKKLNSGKNKNRIKNFKELSNEYYTWNSLFPPNNIKLIIKKMEVLFADIEKECNIKITDNIKKTLLNIELMDDDEQNDDDEYNSCVSDNEDDEDDDEEDEDKNKDKDNIKKNIYQDKNYLIKNGIFKIHPILLTNEHQLKTIIIIYILDNIKLIEKTRIISLLLQNKNSSVFSFWNILKK